MKLREKLQKSIIYLDGGMGTLLQERGLLPGELPERWNISRSNEIIKIHRDYFDAGSNIVNANTFGANALKFSDDELEAIIASALENAKIAREQSKNSDDKYIALDIGPSGKLLKPYGDLDFEDAVSIFAKTVKLGVKYGADLIYIETMNDSYETKAAILAAKENSSLPVFVSNAYGEDEKLMTGATPAAMVAMLEGLGVDAIGVNCSLGPKQLMGVVDEILEYASVPVIMKPNAGLPCTHCGKTHYDVSADEFSDDVAEMVRRGVKIVGGCCGTTPEYIKKTLEKTKNIVYSPIIKKHHTLVSSYSHAVEIGNEPVLIGERINPTGKKRFKQALLENDIAYILTEGLNQQEKGVHILDVNVGLPGIDEREMLKTVLTELQAVTYLPLQIDTASPEAMEAALRLYNGKPMINSVNGKQESLDAILPLAKKYGGVLVALTLDEDGIPDSTEERIEIAKRILNEAEKHGVDKKNIVFDTLSMAVSADTNAPAATLGALEYIRKILGVNTVLGVSNISFGLPARDAINAGFFAFALERGLSAAIINPYSADMLKTYYSFLAIHGMDKNCEKYIDFASNVLPSMLRTDQNAVPTSKSNVDTASELQNAIIKGLKEKSAILTKSLLKERDPLVLINEEVVPALDIVGKGFEEKRMYLPQLLMSAEAAKAAFEEIKCAILASGKSEEKKAKIVLATVKGDIHDIGKNIVKVLLENYGFDVIDLGRDVPPETVVEAVIRENAELCGLSALMTTTVPAMEETIKQLKASAPSCKTIVGGAVLTKDYAESIGADHYAKDAMETVRIAEKYSKI